MALATRAASEAIGAAAPPRTRRLQHDLPRGGPTGPGRPSRPQILRAGRSFSTAEVTVSQDGKVRVRHTATFADLDAHSEPVHLEETPPELPDPESCAPAARGGFAEKITLLDRIDLRIDPATVGWALGQPARDGEMRAWIRFADGREPDVASLPFFLDAMPPVTFTFGALGWAPTIAFSGHIRSRPAPGWLRMRITTRNVIGGLFEEDAMIWDSRDRVVAQSRQLAGVRMPAARRAWDPRPRRRLRPNPCPTRCSAHRLRQRPRLPARHAREDRRRPRGLHQAPLAQRAAPPHPRGRRRVPRPRRLGQR